MDLIEEHGGIMLMLSIMKKVAEKLKAGEEVSKEHIDKILEFLVNFADKCHHGKEEDMLFPEMIKNHANQGLVAELLDEHQTARVYIKSIADSLKNYEPGNSDVGNIAVNMEKYIELLTEHVRKENNQLFPIANKEFSPETQEQMAENFENFEHDVIGGGKHEEYHGWLEELKKAYLS